MNPNPTLKGLKEIICRDWRDITGKLYECKIEYPDYICDKISQIEKLFGVKLK